MRRIIIIGSIWIVLLCFLAAFRASVGEKASQVFLQIVVVITVYQLFCLLLNSFGMTDQDLRDWWRRNW